MKDNAYILIGRAIIEWGQFERLLLRQIWRAKDPTRKSPFPPPVSEQGFYSLWNRWCALHQTAAADRAKLEALRKRMVQLNTIRDDLCHNAFEVAFDQYFEFSIGVERRARDWRGAFDRWAAKYAKSNLRTRPPPPADQHILRYDRRDLDALLTGLAEARKQADDYAAALAAGTAI